MRVRVVEALALLAFFRVGQFSGQVTLRTIRNRILTALKLIVYDVLIIALTYLNFTLSQRRSRFHII
jgi:hypothetical protein